MYFLVASIKAWHFTAYYQRSRSVPGSHSSSSYNMWRNPASEWLKTIRSFRADAQLALEAVERLQAKLKERGEAPTQEKLSLLKTVLQSPLFHNILSLQQAQRKPPVKVQSEHDCVGVLVYIGWWGSSRNRSQNTECANQTG